MNQASILQIEDLCKVFATNQTPALSHINFRLQQGEILGLLGPSGCGKTTLLRLIAGFETPTEGHIALNNQIVSAPDCNTPPERRNTGMVFQDYALFPHFNIADNIAFGLRHRHQKLSKPAIKQRIEETLALVGLAGLEKRYPHELSGGQQQRIALARALAPRPALILLDEPLSNLDVQVRHHLRQEIRQIIKASGISAIFVTHDQEEALAISDRIAVMRAGKMEQLGTPEEIYTRPSSRFVAEFVTQANFLPAKICGDTWETEIGKFRVAAVVPHTNDAEGELMVREEELDLIPHEEAPVVVRERQFLGREYRYCLQTDSGKYLHARTGIQTMVPVGSRVEVKVQNEKPHFFLAR
ncbi:Fe(3+)-transporting ATPase [[Leptolyngbya] sp. PCC 7376]|uniref:ABC transporter ATP-binding protein n=1 Tax=[Leptolyngbya] sp. PCC 7376 TaxID=111781 RepID=UPI00029F1C43|nr:ABC transporter ATP-binding protein [[Leptolyngbya] sp. PCC 7376]AFY39061.1 Fe(3+)-transporting ATPase [[Leptolyngbya] sp. PCC 7376]